MLNYLTYRLFFSERKLTRQCRFISAHIKQIVTVQVQKISLLKNTSYR